MRLTRHATSPDFRWALDGKLLGPDFTLSMLLTMRKSNAISLLNGLKEQSDEEPTPFQTTLLTPVEPEQEVWACGVTYLRSRMEREAESASADVYARVYEADRPEVFFKSVGWRVVGDGQPIRTRRDSTWDVPEPELTLVLNEFMEVIGYTAGNDMSSRSIEGENPLYLPQAKMYDGACAIGSGIEIADVDDLAGCPITISIHRGGGIVFQGEASTGQMKRSMSELAEYVGRELTFPHGVFLMTGTGIVPGPDFTLECHDQVKIRVGEVELLNTVAPKHSHIRQ